MVDKANHKLFPLVFEFRLITILTNGSLSGSYHMALCDANPYISVDWYVLKSYRTLLPQSLGYTMYFCTINMEMRR